MRTLGTAGKRSCAKVGLVVLVAWNIAIGAGRVTYVCAKGACSFGYHGMQPIGT